MISNYCVKLLRRGAIAAALGILVMGPAPRAAEPKAPAISADASAAIARMGKTLAGDHFAFKAWTLRVYADSPKGQPLLFPWGRVLRDAAADVLPFAQVGGLFVGVRAVQHRGVSERVAIASQIADLSKAGLTGIALSLLNYADELPYFCDEVIGRLERMGIREKPVRS